MALSIDLSASIASTRESFTITDGTTYGGANAARADVGVFLTAYKVNSEGESTALDVTPDDDDPELTESWSIEYDVDGYYKIPFAIIPDFNSSSTYSEYDAVYDSASGNVYRSLSDSNTEDDLSNTTYWELISDPSSLAANKDTSTESTNITSQVYQRVFSANGQYHYANMLSAQGIRADSESLETLQGYNHWAMLLDQIAIADSRQEVEDGELIARYVESRFIDPNA
jgi:hypothetical protein